MKEIKQRIHIASLNKIGMRVVIDEHPYTLIDKTQLSGDLYTIIVQDNADKKYYKFYGYETNDIPNSNELVEVIQVKEIKEVITYINKK